MAHPESLCVLLVEDSDADAALVEAHLSGEFRVCERVCSQSEALEALQRDTPDVVLLDLSLPDSEGIESLDPVLACTRSPVVVLTGRQDHELALEAMRRGAQDYLDKSSLDAAGLQRAVRYAMERADAQRTLEAAARYRSLGLLAGGLAHDFNNLIMGISGFAELALGDGDVGNALELRQILAIVGEAKRLTGQLHAYVGNRTAEQEEIDLCEFLQQRAELLTSLASSHGVELRVLLPNERVLVQAVASELEEATVNLLENAVEACTGQPHARVELRVGMRTLGAEDLDSSSVRASNAAPGPFAVLEVQDTGPGVTDRISRAMFDPFFSTKATGRGLGLCVVQGLARGRGGVVLLGRTDSGLRVSLALPGCSAPHSAAPPAGIPRAQASLDGRKVLVIDDVPEVLQVVTSLLEGLGVVVDSSLEREDALQQLSDYSEEYSAVVMDLTMPGCPLGAEGFLEAAGEVAPGVPVILSSGYADRELSEPLRARCAFLPKPYSLAQLEGALARVVLAEPHP